MKFRVRWQRPGTLAAAVLLHLGLLWLVLPLLADSAEPPPSDPVEVVMAVPRQPPKPKPPPPKPAERPAETNESAGRPGFQPAPRLPRIATPSFRLTPPVPLPSKPPMALPAASPPAASGPSGAGSGVRGRGPGTGGREGNDYLVRLKAFIDAHKSGDRHVEPNDAELVLVLDRDGVLNDIRVVSSSGDPAVDADIVYQLRRMSPFPKPPEMLFDPDRPLLSVADRWIFPRP